MSENAIRKLKRRIIAVATISFLGVMIVMGIMLYVTNSVSTRSEIHEVLDYIVTNNGEIPKDSLAGDSSDNALDSQEDDKNNPIVRNVQRNSQHTIEDMINSLESLFRVGKSYDSPEFLYSARFFSVFFDTSGHANEIKRTHIASVNEKQAVKYAQIVRKNGKDFGNYGDYFYEVSSCSDGRDIVVFLDCSSQLAILRRLFIYVFLLSAVGGAISFAVLRHFATRIIRPEIRNAELQKQFITNASHELKTPLSVIRANTELMEMMNGETEWTQSTMHQVERLQGLIQNLVLITRAQEQDSKADRVDTDVSKAVQETFDNFVPVASQEHKKLTADIPENIRMTAESGQIRQLASLLIDNAIKYCDDDGEITVRLSKTSRLPARGTQIRLEVSNSYKDGANVDYERFFDRFYREDESHNVDKGGYGIGLSIAESLVEQYKGSIHADWSKGIITFTCILYG